MRYGNLSGYKNVSIRVKIFTNRSS